jgi:hypothetical protein
VEELGAAASDEAAAGGWGVGFFILLGHNHFSQNLVVHKSEYSKLIRPAGQTYSFRG